MKVLILGDLHFGASVPLEYISKFFIHFFQYIDKNNIKTIIQLGDIFDKRKNINFLTLSEANDIFFKPSLERNCQIIALAGNHDCYFRNKNDINSLRLLQQSNMIVVDKVPETITLNEETFDIFPWVNEENIKQTIDLAEKPGSKFAFGHFSFNGFRMNKSQIAEAEMSHTIMKKYERVFSGHYHTISHKDAVLYAGTPYELDWSDYNDIKGFWVLDTKTSELDFEKTPFRLYEKLEYNENKSFDFDEVPDKYIKLIIKNKTDQYVFDRFFDKLLLCKPYDVQILDDEVLKSIDTALGTDIKIQSTGEMINVVVDKLDTKLDKIKLKNLISSVHEEALELAKL